MAVSSAYAIEILGAIECKAGTPITTASILTTYSTANVTIVKTQDLHTSVDGSVMFPSTYDNQNYLVTGHTYTFNKDCILQIGKYKVVT